MVQIKYQGSKSRHAKEILSIILKDRKESSQYFYDLFAGGMNLIDKVPQDMVRVANDIHYYLIEMWKALQNGWNPPKEITKNDYIEARDNKDYCSDFLIGYIGFNGAYNGKYFGGYAGKITTKEGKIRNYPLEAYNNIMKQLGNLQNVKFINLSYDEVELQPNSILYLDPPYKNTTKYKTGEFNYNKFYDWCIDKHNEGHSVFISEYYMPEDRFECVWQKEVNSSLTKDTGAKKNTEKLWIVKTKTK